MKDPQVAELREALGTLQAAVAEGAMTPRSANEALGKIADAQTRRPVVAARKGGR